jgi:NDP-sugar pyrophosphorylase family protein
LITNGDVLTNVDVAGAIAHHDRTKALITLVLMPNVEPERYGGVLIDSDGSVTGFSPPGATNPSFHFTGVQVAEATAFASVREGQTCESTSELYPALIALRPGSIQGLVHECTWHDIGTPRDYLETALALASRGYGPLIGNRSSIDPSADIHDTILWNDVWVGAGVSMTRCVVTDGVSVPNGSSWHGSMIRRADSPLVSDERRVGELAISAI